MEDKSKEGSTDKQTLKQGKHKSLEPLMAQGGRGGLSLIVDAAALAWIRLRLARLTVRVHLLLPVAAAAMIPLGGDLALRYLLLLLALVVHEGGHAACALAMGSRSVEVSIWPIFGRALIERFGDRREAAVALCGPAANLLLASALFLSGRGLDLQLASCPLGDFLATVNLAMGAGNLLPLPPVDGGRALIALFRPGR